MSSKSGLETHDSWIEVLGDDGDMTFESFGVSHEATNIRKVQVDGGEVRGLQQASRASASDGEEMVIIRR